MGKMTWRTYPYRPYGWQALRELAVSACDLAATDSPEATGEWIGEERNANRSSKNDPLISLAWFLYQTITPGCECDDCQSKRDAVATLVYDPHVDAQAIARALG